MRSGGWSPRAWRVFVEGGPCVSIRVAIGAAKIDPDLLTAAERIQYEGYLQREETNAVILGLAKDGVSIKEIVRRTGYSRGLARKVLRGQLSDVFRVRQSSLEVHLPWLDAKWAAGSPERRGAMATAQPARFSWMPSGCRGMGGATATSGEGRDRCSDTKTCNYNGMRICAFRQTSSARADA